MTALGALLQMHSHALPEQLKKNARMVSHSACHTAHINKNTTTR